MSGMAEDASAGELDTALLRRLLRYLRPVLGLAVGAVLALLAASALNLVGPRVLQQAIDVAIPQHDTGLLTTLAAVLHREATVKCGHPVPEPGQPATAGICATGPVVVDHDPQDPIAVAGTHPDSG